MENKPEKCSKCGKEIPSELVGKIYSYLKFIEADSKDLFCLKCLDAKVCSHCQQITSKPTQEAKKIGRILEDDYKWDIEFEACDDGRKHVDIEVDDEYGDALLDIEVDGQQHFLSKKKALKDLWRTYYSFKDGIMTFRIPNILTQDEVSLKETAKVLNKIAKEIDSEESRD